MTSSSAPASEEYRVINLKYRPGNFSEVVGQRSVVRQLQGEIRDNRVGHAYLFSGPRGVGKTSMARIFAKALNCVEGPTPNPCGKCTHCLGIGNDADLDVVEVDAATYTKKDETVELMEGIDRAAFDARYKVYIIDEVHMFSTHSFNVLLKRLEEPPPGVVFILATTNPEKIPETVISRCRRLEFDRMEPGEIVDRLKEIAEKENVRFAEGERDRVLEAVALASEGGMRDAQVALDQLISLSDGEISLETARQLLGFVEGELLFDLLSGLIDRNTGRCLFIVQELVEKGRDLQRFIKTFTAFLRDVMLLKADAPEELLRTARSESRRLRELADNISMPAILNFVQQFLELEERLRSAAPARFLLEFALIKLTAIHPRFVLDQLETAGSSGTAGDGKADSVAEETAPAPVTKGKRSRNMARSMEVVQGRGAEDRTAPQALLLASGAAVAEPELADVEIGEPSAGVTGEDAIERFRDMIVRNLPRPCAGSLAAAGITIPEADKVLLTLRPREDIIRTLLERPENRQKLREATQEAFGVPCRVEILLATEVAVGGMTSSAIEQASDDARTVTMMEPGDDESVLDDGEVLQQPQAGKPARKMTFKDALAEFPDLREAVDLIRKHCGATPALFNGQRI